MRANRTTSNFSLYRVMQVETMFKLMWTNLLIDNQDVEEVNPNAEWDFLAAKMLKILLGMNGLLLRFNNPSYLELTKPGD
jgi:hypothetical protein